MQIYEVTDARFRKYGKVIRNIDFSALTEAMKKTPVPSDVVYEPSIAELEALPVAKEIEKVFYGELPIQIGYCNGHNVLLNAVEYHRSSEINVAVTDLVLLIGSHSVIPSTMPRRITFSNSIKLMLTPFQKHISLCAQNKIRTEPVDKQRLRPYQYITYFSIRKL